LGIAVWISPNAEIFAILGSFTLASILNIGGHTVSPPRLYKPDEPVFFKVSMVFCVASVTVYLVWVSFNRFY